MDLKDGISGGVLDTTAFALRVACIILHIPPRERVIFLDEPFRHFDDLNGKRERAAALLEMLSEELKIQFIIITHDPKFRLGHVVDLGENHGKRKTDLQKNKRKFSKRNAMSNSTSKR